MRGAAIGLAAFFCGCVHYRTVSTLGSTEVGERGAVPAGFASGETAATWVLGFGPFGSESPDRAVQRARGKALETTMKDVTVERYVTCVFECRWPLIRRVKIVASGSLVKPTRYRDADRPEAPEPIISQRLPKPSVATLAERLQSFYVRDPVEAESYYQSLSDDARAELGRYVVSGLGLVPVSGDAIRAPSSAGTDECKFLAWFLQTHTTYRLSAETCPTRP